VWVYGKDYRGPEGVGGKRRGRSRAGKRGEIIATLLVMTINAGYGSSGNFYHNQGFISAVKYKIYGNLSSTFKNWRSI
jgi:hypothetical protein